MGAPPRVALFADSFHEVNGLALTVRSLTAFAGRHALPLLSIRGGARTDISESGTVVGLDLARSRFSVPLDPGLAFDPFWPRHLARIGRVLDRFAPEIIHVTGVNDMGQLGAWVAHRRRLPLVASWHTNVHEFAARRVSTALRALPAGCRQPLARGVEQGVWKAAARFFRLSRLMFVPNQDLLEQLEAATARPARLMRRGIDAELFSPARRSRADAVFRIGYVGRLAPEKNVRTLAALEARLAGAGARDVEFVIVGEGRERPWLEGAMRRAHFTGVLRGVSLARAYADMDLFVFPSETDTFGNVVLEALASGVPAIVTDRGGPRSVIRPGTDGFVVRNMDECAEAVLRVMRDTTRHRQMKAAARAHALASSWDAVFRQVYDGYAEVLAEWDRAAASRTRTAVASGHSA